MAKTGITRIVALDGGTTNTRARLIEEGRIRAVARRTVGVRDNVLDAAGSPLVRAVRECVAEVLEKAEGPVDRVVAAGMLSAEVGLVAVPHVLAPAGLDELAAAAVEKSIPEVHDRPLLVVPGIRTPAWEGPGGWTSADLMRGEEVETFGTMIASGVAGPAAFYWPGSHGKLVVVDERGRITSSFTTLAGEMTATLASRTLIAKSLPGELPDAPDLASAREGARVARREGLGRAAFLVRVADVTGALDEHRRASFWIGAVIGDDAKHAAAASILDPNVPLWVGGREPQRSLYAEFLAEERPGPVRLVDDAVSVEASALGAWEIARRRA